MQKTFSANLIINLIKKLTRFLIIKILHHWCQAKKSYFFLFSWIDHNPATIEN
jgi:hypothetical protein